MPALGEAAMFAIRTVVSLNNGAGADAEGADLFAFIPRMANGLLWRFSLNNETNSQQEPPRRTAPPDRRRLFRELTEL